MSRSLGDEKRGQNFEILATAPIDARHITPTKASLTSLTGKYNGMICAVNNDTTNNGLYICSQNQGVDDDDWTAVGSSISIDDTIDDTDNAVKNSAIQSALNDKLNLSGGTLTGGLSISGFGNGIACGGASLNSGNIVTTGVCEAAGGIVSSNGGATLNGDLQIQNSGTTKLKFSNGNARLGINTDSPTETLDVNGSIMVKDTVKAHFPNNTSAFAEMNYTGFYGCNSQNMTIQSKGNNTGEGIFFKNKNGNNNPIDTMCILMNGDVGIGTTTPTELLHIDGGNIKITGTHNVTINSNEITKSGNSSYTLGTFNNQSLIFKTSNATRMTINGSGNLDVITTGDGTGTDTSSQLKISDDESSNPQYLKIGVNSTNNYSYIQSTQANVDDNTISLNPRGGNVGIGTTAPTEKLHIDDGNIIISGTNGKGLILNGTSASANWKLLPSTGVTTKLFRIYDNDNSLDRLVINDSGNVGIGTTSPTELLHIDGGNLKAQLAKIGNLDFGSVGNPVLYAGFAYDTNFTTTNYAFLQGSGGETFVNAKTGKYVAFRINNSDKMRLLSNGNIGIANNSPQYTLDVTGDINFTGNLTQNGSAFSSGGGITASSTDTLTNKSLSGADNTFSSIPQSAITNLNTALNARQNNLTSSSNIEVGFLIANNKMFLIVGNNDGSNDGNTNDHQFKITNALLANDTNSIDLKFFVNKANLYGAIQVTQNNVGGKPLKLQPSNGNCEICSGGGDILIGSSGTNLEDTLTTLTSRPFIKACAKVDGNAATAAFLGSYGFTSVTRSATGTYDFVFSTNAANHNYIVNANVIENNNNSGRDAIIVQIEATTMLVGGFSLIIHEGDNGGTAGVLRNRDFTVSVIEY